MFAVVAVFLLGRRFFCGRVGLAAAAFYGSFLMGGTHFWASFVLLVIAGAMMYAPYGPYFAYLAESLPRNVAGGAIALINSMGALGSFVGAYGVGRLNDITGSPGMSYLMMAAETSNAGSSALLGWPWPPASVPATTLTPAASARPTLST